MRPREKLQQAYELAFFPPRLDHVWTEIKNKDVHDKKQLIELLEMALTLHRVLPEQNYSSMRALKRLAHYQAISRDFGQLTFLRNVYEHYTGKSPDLPDQVPGEWVRDIGLPPFNHHAR
jgi:hypothetical protein